MRKSAVLNYGMYIDGRPACVPFYIVNDVIVNYTFIVPDRKGIEYDSNFGKLKENAIRSLGADMKKIEVPAGSEQEMINFISHTMSTASFVSRAINDDESGSKLKNSILFLIPKTSSNDIVFYKGVGIKPDASSSGICDAKSLGLTPIKPFMFFDFEDLIEDFKDGDIGFMAADDI